MEHLERHIYNSVEGCAVAMASPPKVRFIFYNLASYGISTGIVDRSPVNRLRDHNQLQKFKPVNCCHAIHSRTMHNAIPGNSQYHMLTINNAVTDYL
jgi:hypothetical protein